MAALRPHLSSLGLPPSKPQPLKPPSATTIFQLPPTTGYPFIQTTETLFKCSAGQAGFFNKLGRLIKEKAKSDVEKIFSGFSKTRDNLAVIDELLLYWNLSDTDRVLDELEEVRTTLFGLLGNDKIAIFFFLLQCQLMDSVLELLFLNLFNSAY